MFKLSKRILFVPLLILAFYYLFYSAYTAVKNRVLGDFSTAQFALAHQSSRGIESFFIYYQRELQFLSKLSYISSLDENGKNLLTQFYRNHSDQIEAITVVDSKGFILFTYPLNDSVLGKDISVQSHIREILQTHKPTVSDVFDAVQGYKAIAYHIPIIAGNEYKGSIAILIPLEKLGKRYIETIKTMQTGYGWLMSERAIELYHPVAGIVGDPVKDIYKDSPTVLDLIDRCRTESEGTGLCSVKSSDGESIKTEEIIGSFTRVTLGNTYWTILIFTPEQEVLDTLKSFRNRLYLLSLLIVLVMTTYFFLSFKASSILREEKKRKALEDILRESEKRFRVMFELSPAGIILIDGTGSIIEVNSSFCKTLGYLREEIIGKNIRMFAFPRVDGEVEKHIDEILSGKTLRHEITNLKKDGSTADFEIYETMIYLPDGKPGILSVSTDVTEKKLARMELISAKEKAEESDRLKSAFLANISHELRTPLNAIIGFSSLMADNSRDEDTKTGSNIIFKSGIHLLNLVEDVFDIAIIETGQIKIVNEKTDLTAILEEVKDIVTGELILENKTDVELILNSGSKSEHIYTFTDKRKVKQVLINLLRNALKFTAKGSIEFGFSLNEENQNRMIQFYVKDTGIGIDKKDQEVIFNTFRQLDDTHTRKFSGMGIGLSISRKLIEKIGGSIWVESEKGKGSVFYFTIPDLPESSKHVFNTSPGDEIIHKDYTGKTILIVEDEVSNYDLLKVLLTRKNATVLWAKDGIEAVNICREVPEINIVLMDIKLPLLNGYEATRRIKKDRSDLIVIAQTAFASSLDKEEALKNGCSDYISKPIQSGKLFEIINKYL